MRQFVLIGHEVPTTPDFPLEDLPGAGGRIDVLSRCVNAAFFLSHGFRESVRVRLVLNNEFTLRFEGERLKGLNPDERSTAARIRSALERREEAIGHQEVETTPGVFLSRQGLPILETAAGEGTLVQLHEAGDPITEVDMPNDPVFVLSDHRDFTDAEKSMLSDRDVKQIRIGPRALHAEHAITVVHNYLDTDGHQRY